MIVQIGYVGSSARHLLSLLDINQAKPGVYADTVDLFGNVIVGADSKTSADSPVLQPLSAIWQYQPDLKLSVPANYNSLQAQLRASTNWHHFTAQAVYTWSHNLDEVSRLPWSPPPGQHQLQRVTTATRSMIAATASPPSLSYEVPGSQHLKRLLTNGWQVNSVISLPRRSQPFTVNASGNFQRNQ